MKKTSKKQWLLTRLFCTCFGQTKLFAAACKRCALCLVTVAGAATLYANLSGMALTFIVVRAVCSLTVNRACGRRLAGYVAVGIAFALLKAVAAGLLGTLGRVAAYHDSVQITVKILVVGTCLYGTS